ncbi:MAG: hypothetical protein VB051_06810 [Candidatus Pelethousia sp.]|nr:hypothetical protein [Candidatus Pelethousia sp.]
MKKIFASVLAAVMVLAVASSAMAFSWGPGSGSTAESFSNRYKIEVVKLANETGIIGTNRLIEAPGATAVNNASVYFYIRLIVSGAPSEPDAIQENACADVSFTSLSVMNAGGGYTGGSSNISLASKGNGVYYYNVNTGDFELITGSINNSVFSGAAIEARCLDTATAKVHAKVYSKRPFKVNGTPTEFQAGSYYILVDGDNVMFADKAGATAGNVAGTNCIKFVRNSSSRQVTDVVIMQATSDGNWVDNLYTYLGFRAPDITGGRIYMTDDNIRSAFGFDYKGEASITWNANSSAIILDPVVTVGIPKTGDNAGVIGFALVMLAAIGAAVAVKKVKA